jgi:hypothetical protein
MTLLKPSANTLIDQTFLGQIVDEINILSDNFSNAASPIFDTTSKTSSLTYFGGFSFATTQLEVTQTLKATEASRYTANFAFGKDFLAPPLVFATIESDAITGTGSTAATLLNGVAVSGITTGGGTVAVILDADSRKPTIKYRINILAIGIPQI